MSKEFKDIQLTGNLGIGTAPGGGNARLTLSAGAPASPQITSTVIQIRNNPFSAEIFEVKQSPTGDSQR